MLANPEAEAFFQSRSARDEVGSALIESLKKCGEYDVRGDLRTCRSPYAVTAGDRARHRRRRGADRA